MNIENDKKINEDILIPDDFDKRVQCAVKSSKRGGTFYRNKKYISLGLVLVICLNLFNPAVRAFAADVPIIGDIMEWFQHDKGIDLAIENDYPVGEKVINQDGYKLTMKDVYLDEDIFTMKMALENESGEYIKLDSVDMYSYQLGINRESYTGENPDIIGPWREMVVDLARQDYREYMFQKYDYIDMKLAIHHDGETINFKDIAFEEDELGDGKPRVIDIQKQMASGVLIENLSIYPNRMEIGVSLEETNKGETYFGPDTIILKDNDNKEYEFYIKHYYGADWCLFESKDSIYFDREKSFKEGELSGAEWVILECDEIKVSDLQKNGTRELNLDGSKYEVGIDDDDIVINVGKDSMKETIVVKIGEKWKTMRINKGDIDQDIVNVFRLEVEKALGKEIEDIMKLQGEEFNEYCEKYSEYIIEIMNDESIREQKQVYFKNKFKELLQQGKTTHISLDMSKRYCRNLYEKYRFGIFKDVKSTVDKFEIK